MFLEEMTRLAVSTKKKNSPVHVINAFPLNTLQLLHSTIQNLVLVLFDLLP